MSIDQLPGVPGGDRTAGDGDPGSGVALVRLDGPAGRVVLHLSADLRRWLTAEVAEGLTARLRRDPPRPFGDGGAVA